MSSNIDSHKSQLSAVMQFYRYHLNNVASGPTDVQGQCQEEQLCASPQLTVNEEVAAEDKDDLESEVVPPTPTFNMEIYINELKNFPAIWDTSCRSYHDQNLRKNAWDELAANFGKPVSFLKSTWKNLCDNLKRCLVRRKAATKSGAATTMLPKCRYYEQLSFIHDKIMNKETHSNVTVTVLSPSTLHQDENASSNEAMNMSASSKAGKRKKGGKQRADTEFDDRFASSNDEDDDNMLFCKSIVPSLRNLSARSNKIARIQIQQILFDLEFKDE